MTRLVAVGCGRVFERFHLPALRALPEWNLVGAADIRGDRLAWAATAAGVDTAESLAPLLSRLHPDAVLITTSPQSHRALAVEALRGGAHVLIEKPMVLDVPEADLLVGLARSLGRKILVGFNRRFRPAYAKLRTQLATHPQRPVRAARFELCSDPVVWRPVSSHQTGSDPGAGLLEDIASHQLDLLPWMLGREPIGVRARSVQRDALGTRIEIDLQFPENLVASCLAGHVPGYVERLELRFDSDGWLAGPGGVVRLGVVSTALGQRYLEARATAQAVARKLMGRPGETLETFRRQYRAWAMALGGPRRVSGVTDAADGQAGARCVALVSACRRSLALDGTWVDVAANSATTRS